MKRNIFKKSQGVVESVVAVGILMAVLTGTILLISFGLSNRKTGFDRRKANELATLVMEEQVSRSISNPEQFWISTSVTETTKPEFDGYSYTIDFNWKDDISGCNKRPGVNECADVILKVTWQGKEPQTLTFNRFFSR